MISAPNGPANENQLSCEGALQLLLLLSEFRGGREGQEVVRIDSHREHCRVADAIRRLHTYKRCQSPAAAIAITSVVAVYDHVVREKFTPDLVAECRNQGSC